MHRRDGIPVLFESHEPRGTLLSRVDLSPKSSSGSYDEKWLQDQLHVHPELFPIEQIERGFGTLISLCCELSIPLGGGRQGFLDNLLVTRDGGLVLVEAKLWRNPQARREAVAQALDYAAAVFQMKYSDLQTAVLKARKTSGLPYAGLFEIVASASEGIPEAEFIDAVSLNLERGRAIIAVVGDGIREDIRALGNLVQGHAGHRFTFVLVEMTVYEKPNTDLRIVVPSVLAQTELIERGVVRIERDAHSGTRIVVDPTSSPSQPSADRRMGITEDAFFEALRLNNPCLPDLLKSFLAKAESIGVYAEFQGGLNLKHASPVGKPLNMGTIYKGGIVDTGASTFWDRKSAGYAYNTELANLIGGSTKIMTDENSFVMNAMGKMPLLSDYLPQHEQAWIDAMET